MLNVPFIRVNEYNKISDLVMFIGQNCVLKFNVILNSEGKDGRIENFHKEYQYYSKKYDTNQYTISRKFDYYLTIENQFASEIGFKESIIIGINEMMMFKLLLKSAINWFMDSQYSNMYANKDGKLVLVNPQTPKRAVFKSKYIEIEPIVYISQEDSYDFGVRMYLNSETNYTELSFNKLCGLYYIIDSLNLYQAAITLINYLQRPEFGTNLISYVEGTKYENTSKMPSQKSGRYIQEINVFNQKRNKLEDSLE